jgi:hypothetical protein
MAPPEAGKLAHSGEVCTSQPRGQNLGLSLHFIHPMVNLQVQSQILRLPCEDQGLIILAFKLILKGICHVFR